MSTNDENNNDSNDESNKIEDDNTNDNSTTNTAFLIDTAKVKDLTNNEANSNNLTENNIEDDPQVQLQLSSMLPTDWTNINKIAGPACRIVFPWDIVDETPYTASNDNDNNHPSNCEEISIIGTTGQKITKMGNDLSKYYSSTKLKTLIFRSHIIRKIEGLSNLQSLEVLELYDNAIDSLDGVNDGDGDGGGGVPCKTLRILDMSYNVIRDMGPVQYCPHLVELYLAQNKLKTIQGIKHLSKLKKLDLGANRIRKMDSDELSGLTNLEDLWLGKNKIDKIQGLEKFTKLRRLDVQSNRLISIENISSQVCSTIEELYLAGNGITDDGISLSNSTTGLCGQLFPNLLTLDLSKNLLTDTKFLTTSATSKGENNNFPSLEDLWISGNNITSFDSISNLSLLGSTLEVIYLEFNPIDKDFYYRKTLKELIPSLEQIDANRIGHYYSGTGGTGDGNFSMEDRMKEFQKLALDKAKGGVK